MAFRTASSTKMRPVLCLVASSAETPPDPPLSPTAYVVTSDMPTPSSAATATAPSRPADATGVLGRCMERPEAYERPFSRDQYQTDQHAKVDNIPESDASSHFLIVGALLLHKQRAANPITVTVANGQRVQSTHDGALDISGLPPRARYAHVILGIKHLLLSIVRLCNAGCEIVFGRWGLNVEVRHGEKLIMTGRKRTNNGLWYVPVTKISEDTVVPR